MQQSCIREKNYGYILLFFKPLAFDLITNAGRYKDTSPVPNRRNQLPF
jgi:hypothetical protein